MTDDIVRAGEEFKNSIHYDKMMGSMIARTAHRALPRQADALEHSAAPDNPWASKVRQEFNARLIAKCLGADVAMGYERIRRADRIAVAPTDEMRKLNRSLAEKILTIKSAAVPRRQELRKAEKVLTEMSLRIIQSEILLPLKRGALSVSEKIEVEEILRKVRTLLGRDDP